MTGLHGSQRYQTLNLSQFCSSMEGRINKTNHVGSDKHVFKAKATQSSEVKELTIIFKPRLSAPYVEQIVAKLRGLHIVAQPIRLIYPLSVSLIAEQVQNLHEETKENHMLIPIFHALLLCSPKEGITKGMSSFSLYLYEKLLSNSSGCIWSKRNLNFALV